MDSVDGDLAADEEDEEGDCGPEDFFTEGNLKERGGETGQINQEARATRGTNNEWISK